jgi:hypothetical protein
MPTIDLSAAERFVYANARLIDRHRLAVLRHGAPASRVLDAIAAYRNPDGGFGHALEPDVRGPHSEPAATLHALDVLAGIGALDHPFVRDAAAFIASIAEPDGRVPFVVPAAADYPRGPWMVDSPDGFHLTFAVAAKLHEAGLETPWRERATASCWERVEADEPLSAYALRFALDLLDAVRDAARAEAAIERLRPLVGADGTIPVPGGTADERLTPLTLSVRRDGRSRRLFTAAQIDEDLDRLAAGQQEDGGFDFDWLAWSPGQTVEWRGILTVRAIVVLGEHGRL